MVRVCAKITFNAWRLREANSRDMQIAGNLHSRPGDEYFGNNIVFNQPIPVRLPLPTQHPDRNTTKTILETPRSHSPFIFRHLENRFRSLREIPDRNTKLSYQFMQFHLVISCNVMLRQARTKLITLEYSSFFGRSKSNSLLLLPIFMRST